LLDSLLQESSKACNGSLYNYHARDNFKLASETFLQTISFNRVGEDMRMRLKAYTGPTAWYLVVLADIV